MFLVLFTSTVYADLEHLSRAMCKINATSNELNENGKEKEKVGSGIIVYIDNKIYIMTAAHVVVNTNKTIRKEIKASFFLDGYGTKYYPAKLEWYKFENQWKDIAIITVSENVPLPLKRVILKKHTYLNDGATLFSYGYPSKTYPTGWIGHLDSKTNTHMFFTPMPLGGRSGSGISDVNNNLLGIITHRYDLNRRDHHNSPTNGLAIRTDYIYKLLVSNNPELARKLYEQP